MNSFNAKSWIKANCDGGKTLKQETLNVVSNFTLMWSFFEATLCNKDADIKALESVSNKIGKRPPLPVEIQTAVRFWSERYVRGGEFNNLFETLCFRRNDRREDVEAVLRCDKNDPESQLLAVMIIIYRLRNNLFHGLKQISELNDQVPNLTVACRTLAAVMEVSDSPLFIAKAADD